MRFLASTADLKYNGNIQYLLSHLFSVTALYLSPGHEAGVQPGCDFSPFLATMHIRVHAQGQLIISSSPNAMILDSRRKLKNLQGSHQEGQAELDIGHHPNEGWDRKAEKLSCHPQSRCNV